MMAKLIVPQQAKTSQNNEQQVQKQEDYARQATFDEIMRNAIKDSQRHTHTLYQAGISKSAVFENTPDAIIEAENDGDIDLDFFNTLNGF